MLAIIGGLILGGEPGLAILKVISSYWPLILVLIGTSIIVRYIKTGK